MNHGKWKINLNHIFMLYKSAETCHPVSLPRYKYSHISNLWGKYFTCRYDLYNHWYNLYTRGWDVFTCKNFLCIAHTSSIPMGAINFYMQERFLHLMIPLLFSCWRCIYMQECSVDSFRMSSIPMGAMSELETCFEPV